MKIADVANIKTVPHTLVRLADGELGYLTKRVDRSADGKPLSMIHVWPFYLSVDDQVIRCHDFDVCPNTRRGNVADSRGFSWMPPTESARLGGMAISPD